MKLTHKSMAFSALFLAATVAIAGLVTLDARNAPYSALPSVQNVSVRSMAEVRVAALSASAGAYRGLAGMQAITRLKPGEQFKMIYKDGSYETALVDSQSADVGAVPINGTQYDKDGNPLSATGNGGGVYEGSTCGVSYEQTVVGWYPIYATGTVCTPDACTSQTVLVGYEPIYGMQAVNDSLGAC